MSPVFTTTAHVASPATALSAADIANIFEHSWTVETAGATLVTVLVTWLVTLVITRKRIAWRVYTDDDFKLHPNQADSVGDNILLKIQVPSGVTGAEPDVVDDPRLVVLRIRNSGLMDLKKGDFDPPVQFIFPGRQVRHAARRPLTQAMARSRSRSTTGAAIPEISAARPTNTNSGPLNISTPMVSRPHWPAHSSRTSPTPQKSAT